MRFGIFIYDGVEPVDLATYGVLSMARRVADAATGLPVIAPLEADQHSPELDGVPVAVD
jgi:hypothetical protein